MLRKIFFFPNPVLREKCQPVGEVTDEIRTLVDDMLETMVEADGIGLAAPQIGLTIQLAVVDISGSEEPMTYLRVDGKDTALEEIMPLVFMNPELEFGPTRWTMEEGCLSIPEVRANVTRPDALRVRFDTLDSKRVEMETDGLLARVIQHECDHLFGVLFIDRLTSAQKLSLKKALRELKAEQAGR